MVTNGRHDNKKSDNNYGQHNKHILFTETSIGFNTEYIR